jgi:general secretion pathway protein L
MTTLVVSLPVRPRLHPGQGSLQAVSTGPAEFDYVLSDDGLELGGQRRQGRAAPALMPRADELVAVLPVEDLSWHRITCPRAAAAKLGPALAGVLEDAVLDDPQRLHFALEPGARGGEAAWVAATDRQALEAAIATLESAGQRVDRVVPAAWPGEPATGHFHGDTPALRLTWSHGEGVLDLPLQGGLARVLLPEPLPAAARFSATPAAAAEAERWLGHSVSVQGAAERALDALRSPWNLRQFGLAPRHRGLAVLREALRSVLAPAWRPARWGVVTLVAVQLLGLNLAAWQQSARLAERRAEMTRLLTTTHPQVRAILDPALQMQRETDLLRVAAGRSGEADLEAALQVAASIWGAHGPVQTLQFEAGSLTLSAPGWSEAEITALRQRVAPSGWQVQSAGGVLTLSRAPAGGGA